MKLSQLLLLALLALPVTRSAAQNVTLASNDLKVLLHEESINKMFKAIGDINGKSEYEIMFFKGSYDWTMMNPRIILKPGKGEFVTDVRVQAGLISYSTQVAGNVDIWYDVKTNLINVKITKAIFEIYTKVIGQKIHIKNIDLAEYFTDPFTFEGPMTLNTDMLFELPDGRTKKIFIKPSKCELRVLEKIVEVACELEFSEKLFIAPTYPLPGTTIPAPVTK